MAPIRSARSRTCAADSSPVMYRTGAAAARGTPPPGSSVDLPTPGSPATAATRPGHQAAAQHPVQLVQPGRAGPRGAGVITSPMGTAGSGRGQGGWRALRGRCPSRRRPALTHPGGCCRARQHPGRPGSAHAARAALPKPAARVTAGCSTVPQAWHSPQRPDQLVVRHPPLRALERRPRRGLRHGPDATPGHRQRGAGDTPGLRHSCAPCGEQLAGARRISWQGGSIVPGIRSALECGRSHGEPSGHSAATPGGAINRVGLSGPDAGCVRGWRPRLGYDGGRGVMVTPDAVSQERRGTAAARRLSRRPGARGCTRPAC